MTIKRSEIIDYLIKEQDYPKDMVEEMTVWELIDLYEMYHED